MTTQSLKLAAPNDPKSISVLFTAAGRRVELIECFRRDARALRAKLRVIMAELNPEASAACHFADAVHRVPPVDSPEYLAAVLDICRRESVDLLVPLLDPELALLAGARRRFERIGTRLALSSPNVVALSRDKLETARELERHGVPVPRTERLESFLDGVDGKWRWPLIAKPAGGSASKGVQVVRDRSELRRLKIDRASYVVQEFVDGPEYTVNVFFDRRGRLRCAVPHRRLEVRAGEVSKAVTERLPALMDAARSVGRALRGARGPLCFQARIGGDGVPQVFEINARFGGGFPLAHRAGARFPLWLMQETLGIEPSWIGDAWKDGLLMLRYDQSVFGGGL